MDSPIPYIAPQETIIPTGEDTKYTIDFTIPEFYRVPTDLTSPANLVSNGYENNVCKVDTMIIVPVGASLEFHSPKIVAV